MNCARLSRYFVCLTVRYVLLVFLNIKKRSALFSSRTALTAALLVVKYVEQEVLLLSSHRRFEHRRNHEFAPACLNGVSFGIHLSPFVWPQVSGSAVSWPLSFACCSRKRDLPTELKLAWRFGL